MDEFDALVVRLRCPPAIYVKNGHRSAGSTMVDALLRSHKNPDFTPWRNHSLSAGNIHAVPSVPSDLECVSQVGAEGKQAVDPF